MNDFNSIDLQELDTVTGGRNLGPLISKAKDWGGKAWNAAEKAVTGLGIADAAGRAWDWASGGNKGGDSGGSPAPSAPEQGGGEHRRCGSRCPVNSEFQTIESDDLDDVTGAGKAQVIGKALKWGWKQVDRGLSALGVYEIGRAAYDYATGGSSQPGGTPPTMPAQPSQPAEGAPQ